MKGGGREPTFLVKEATTIQTDIESTLARLEPAVEVILVESFRSGRGGTIRVYIDHPDGVNREVCARVTDALGDLLDEFNLEVSSPGIERPLTKPDHFKKHIGERIGVHTKTAIDGRRNFKGELIGIESGEIMLDCDDLQVRIPERDIQKSKLLHPDGRVQP